LFYLLALAAKRYRQIVYTHGRGRVILREHPLHKALLGKSNLGSDYFRLFSIIFLIIGIMAAGLLGALVNLINNYLLIAHYW
jgi:hypothetical protein